MRTDLRLGLSSREAALRLQAAGPNELPRGKGRTLGRIVMETMREPMFLLLIGAATVYLLLGDLTEGVFLVAGACATVGLVVVQEARSERALSALREIGQPEARVIRDGAERRIAARALAPGDILLVGEGERLPTDALLVAGGALGVDESALTGESAPVAKKPDPGAQWNDDVEPGPEVSPYLFAGALIVRGQAVAEVTRTGARSSLGRIGQALAAIEQQPTPLQRTAARWVGVLGIFALVFCLLVTLAYGLLRDDWLSGALAGVTVAIALIPEEFPMVLAIFMALGAWRLATHKVLVRRSAVIETLGGASVLCVDKTGTLTENHMRVARIWAEGEDATVTTGMPKGRADQVLRLAAMASSVRPSDPMDRAIQQLSRARLVAAPSGAEPERAWPIRPELMAVIQVWRGLGETRTAAAKGAPEAIFGLCRLEPELVNHLQDIVHAYAQQGLRVLGVASAKSEGGFGEEPSTTRFDFAGLIGFLDPLRADAAAALHEAAGAGIAVVMLTGDHPATAAAIAAQAGIDTSAGVLLGTEVSALPIEDLRQVLQRVRVFARIAPQQKLSIVEALKADGHVVAMTGDGVNDAPALEAAHIGIAMGRKGTDVAREAADLVLLDDSFASIVGGVRLGRRIFDNLRRALTYITAIHVPIAGLALAPILLGLPPLIFPMHVVLLELAIDPISALVFEAEPSDSRAMRRAPRARGELLFGPAQLGLAAIQGGVILATILLLYCTALGHHSTESARGAAFIALVVGNLTLALADARSSGPLLSARRWVFWLIAALVVGVLAGVFVAPAAASAFGVALPDPPLLALAAAAGLGAGGWGLARDLIGRNAATAPQG